MSEEQHMQRMKRPAPYYGRMPGRIDNVTPEIAEWLGPQPWALRVSEYDFVWGIEQLLRDSRLSTLDVDDWIPLGNWEISALSRWPR